MKKGRILGESTLSFHVLGTTWYTCNYNFSRCRMTADRPHYSRIWVWKTNQKVLRKRQARNLWTPGCTTLSRLKWITTLKTETKHDHDRYCGMHHTRIAISHVPHHPYFHGLTKKKYCMYSLAYIPIRLPGAKSIAKSSAFRFSDRDSRKNELRSGK